MPRGPSLKARRFTESVIREMTRQAHEHGAVNLAQGFPDFGAPEALKSAAAAANQIQKKYLSKTSKKHTRIGNICLRVWQVDYLDKSLFTAFSERMHPHLKKGGGFAWQGRHRGIRLIIHNVLRGNRLNSLLHEIGCVTTVKFLPN